MRRLGLFILVVSIPGFLFAFSKTDCHRDGLTENCEAELRDAEGDKGIVDGDTIRVEFNQDNGFVHLVRLAGIDAPELGEKKSAPCQTIAEEAQKQLGILLNGKGISPVRVKLLRTGDFHLVYYTGEYDRLLGFVRKSDNVDPAQIELVRLGLARLDVRQSGLNGIQVANGSDKFAFTTHFEDYMARIIVAQIEAAKDNRGEKTWWGLCDPFKDADLSIAAIKFWDEEQIVYISSRKSVNLDNFVLSDRSNHKLFFNQVEFRQTCKLKLDSNQTLEIHTFNKQGRNTAYCKDGQVTRINWYVKLQDSSQHVWNQSVNEKNPEIACLLLNSNTEIGCTRDSKLGDSGLCYLYRYPPDDGEQTPSSKMIDSGCFPNDSKAGTEKLK